jgi:hypothetical protein
MDSSQFILSLIGVVGGLITVTIGLITYRANMTLKKKDIMKDILVPLMNEFGSDKFKVATDLLDNKKVPNVDNQESNFWYCLSQEYYTKADLEYLLRDRTTEEPKKLTKSHKEIREAFDAFLGFLAKLEYLKKIKIVDEKEIDYFNYFICKAAEQPEVIKYMQIYQFPLHGKLHPNLKVKYTNSCPKNNLE